MAPGGGKSGDSSGSSRSPQWAAALRPRVGLGASGQPRAHGVAFDVAHGSPEVRFVERARVEAALPHVAVHAGAGVEAQRVDRVRVAHGPAEGVFRGGDRDKVDVIAHQAVRPEVYPVLRAIGIEQAQIRRPVRVRLEDVRMTVPARDHVVRMSWHDNSCDSAHAPILAEKNVKVNLFRSLSLNYTRKKKRESQPVS